MKRAAAEAEDAGQVLSGGGLHPLAAASLDDAVRSIRIAIHSDSDRYISDALDALSAARDRLIES